MKGALEFAWNLSLSNSSFLFAWFLCGDFPSPSFFIFVPCTSTAPCRQEPRCRKNPSLGQFVFVVQFVAKRDFTRVSAIATFSRRILEKDCSTDAYSRTHLRRRITDRDERKKVAKEFCVVVGGAFFLALFLFLRFSICHCSRQTKEETQDVLKLFLFSCAYASFASSDEDSLSPRFYAPRSKNTQ